MAEYYVYASLVAFGFFVGYAVCLAREVRDDHPEQ